MPLPQKPTTLQQAIHRKDYAEFRKLLPTHAGELNALEEGGGMLHAAAALGDVDGVRVLVEAGADVNLKAVRNAMTPLHRAQTGDVVRELVKGHADLEAKTSDGGRTPLIMAAISGSCNLVAALLAAGANPNARDDSGRTPLMRVLYELRDGRTPQQRECIIRALAEGGAKLDFYNEKLGATALYLAVQNGHDAEIRLLIRLGADPNFHDTLNPQGALDVALRSTPGRTNEQRLKTCQVLVQSGVSQEIIRETIRAPRSDSKKDNIQIIEFLRGQLSDANAKPAVAVPQPAAPGNSGILKAKPRGV